MCFIKRHKKIWLLTVFQVLIIVLPIIIGGTLIWENRYKFVSHKNQPSNANESANSEITDNYYSPSEWPFFNQEYESLSRHFRFRYPPIFTTIDLEDDKVYLKKDNVYYLGVKEDPRFTGFSHDQFADYYSYYFKRTKAGLPDLSNFERLDLSDNDFVYIITEDKNTNHFAYPSLFGPLAEWNIYLGVIDGHGIFIFDPKRFPEDVVHEIIGTIEFR